MPLEPSESSAEGAAVMLTATAVLAPHVEQFCQIFVRTRHATKAYRDAFGEAATLTHNQVQSRICALRASPHVAARITELLAQREPSGLLKQNSPARALGGPQQRTPALSNEQLHPLLRDVAELEKIAAVIFDASQVEAARLAALRLVTDALLHLAEGSASPIRISISIEQNASAEHVEPSDSEGVQP